MHIWNPAFVNYIFCLIRSYGTQQLRVISFVEWEFSKESNIISAGEWEQSNMDPAHQISFSISLFLSLSLSHSLLPLPLTLLHAIFSPEHIEQVK